MYVILWRFNDRNKWHMLSEIHDDQVAVNAAVASAERYNTDGREYKPMMLRELTIQ